MYTDIKTIENTITRLWIDQGILHIDYKPCTILTLKHAIRITADRLLLQQEKAYPVFVNFHNVKYAERSAREHFAREGSVLMCAVGVFLTLPYDLAIVNFYLGANTPLVPTKVFTDKFQTLNYLKHFIP